MVGSSSSGRQYDDRPSRAPNMSGYRMGQRRQRIKHDG